MNRSECSIMQPSIVRRPRRWKGLEDVNSVGASQPSARRIRRASANDAEQDVCRVCSTRVLGRNVSCQNCAAANNRAPGAHIIMESCCPSSSVMDLVDEQDTKPCAVAGSGLPDDTRSINPGTEYAAIYRRKSSPLYPTIEDLDKILSFSIDISTMAVQDDTNSHGRDGTTATKDEEEGQNTTTAKEEIELPVLNDLQSDLQPIRQSFLVGCNNTASAGAADQQDAADSFHISASHLATTQEDENRDGTIKEGNELRVLDDLQNDLQPIRQGFLFGRDNTAPGDGASADQQDVAARFHTSTSQVSTAAEMLDDAGNEDGIIDTRNYMSYNNFAEEEKEEVQEHRPSLLPTFDQRVLKTLSFLPWTHDTHESDEQQQGWECSTCTFVNVNDLHLTCSVCGTPREKGNSETIIENELALDGYDDDLDEEQDATTADLTVDPIQDDWLVELQEKRMEELIDSQYELFEAYMKEAQQDGATSTATDGTEFSSDENYALNASRAAKVRTLSKRLSIIIDRHHNEKDDQLAMTEKLRLSMLQSSSASDCESASEDMQAEQARLSTWKVTLDERDRKLQDLTRQHGELIQDVDFDC